MYMYDIHIHICIIHIYITYIYAYVRPSLEGVARLLPGLALHHYVLLRQGLLRDAVQVVPT